MRIRFDANLEFQRDAVNAVADLFDGMARTAPFALTPVFQRQDQVSETPVEAVPNPALPPDDLLLANLQAVEARNGLPPDTELQRITANGDSFLNFTVEMETGTGKTYVYIRTALELHRRYGFRKFIIVVPSVAIRENVLTAFRLTRAHFRRLYDNPSFSAYPYDSGNLSRVRQFAQSGGLEFMVMTMAAFNKDANIIRQTPDSFHGARPLDVVRASRPVLILDEPQNMESDLSKEALASLAPLMALRYSATHRETYNEVYRLTPFEAYRQNLVKRIEVAGFEDAGGGPAPFLQVQAITLQGQTPRAKLLVDRLLRSGETRRGSLIVKPGNRLDQRTGRQEYAPYYVEEIDPFAKCVRFRNGQELAEGESTGEDRDALWEAQIRYTVEEHFIKQRRLRERGLKVLSLFFIDRVANYVDQDGTIRVLFDRCFGEVAAKHRADCEAWWGAAEPDPDGVRSGYFACRPTREGATVYEDTSGLQGQAKQEKAAFDLIMKDKERLLSFDEPVAFVFSHSALREGWDSPNVFQICTLNQTASVMKKRQEIGRGVRLAVDQDGERVRDETVNILTVAANQSYAAYVAGLQSEFEEAGYSAPQQPPVRNKREAGTVRLRKERFLSPEFRQLWDRIKHRTRYHVEIDSEKLVADIVAGLEHETITAPSITVQKVALQVTDDDALSPLITTGAKTVLDLTGKFPLPNLVGEMEDLLVRTSDPPLRLSRCTLLEVYRRTPNRAAAAANPREFARVAVAIMKRAMVKQIVRGVRYEKTGECYSMELLDEERDLFAKHIVATRDDGPALYDHVPCDSDPERDFAKGLDADQRVKLFVKLPTWFTVPTPLGEYNPDWAVVAADTDEHGEETARLYLVAETKGSTELASLREDEQHKIACGRSHFEGALEGVRFRAPVTDPAQLWG
jgi:type III restriction enzyme